MNKTEYQEKLVGDILTSLEKHGAKKFLSSVILTGSFGRGEPTFFYAEDGELVLKSDVEIALVFPKGVSKDNVQSLISSVTREFNEDLNLMPISQKRVEKVYNFNFSFFVPKYKTIFTYDLFNGSKTIWGKDFIGKTTVDVGEIDPYEAKRLVGNRIGELVYLRKYSTEKYMHKQWKGKVILAIASSWLLLNNKYSSSYFKQYQILFDEKSAVEQDLGENFFYDYALVFSFLRENGKEYEVSDVRLMEYIRMFDVIIKNKGLKKPKVNSFGRYVKYIKKYMKIKCPLGFANFEDKILQGLITGYYDSSKDIVHMAEIWHRVLY